MASEAVVVRTLQAIANMFNKGSWWVTDSTKMWMIQLDDITDEDLIQGTKDCLRKAKKLPTVANLRDIIEAHPHSANRESREPKGCAACCDTGAREMARWYRKRKALASFFGLAACDCSKGQRLALGAFHDWRKVRDAWESDPWTAKDNEGRPIVFWGTHKQPYLTDAQKLTPEDLAARRTRDRAAAAASKTTGSWHQVGANPQPPAKE